MIVEVGRTKTLDDGKKSRYKYSDVSFDTDGFADADKFHPLKFDLVEGKYVLSSKKANCWWTGKEWLGLRLPPKTKIEKWKRLPYDCSVA